MYQEQLEQRKHPDIFAQPSSSDFLVLLQPESEDPTSSGQVKEEKLCLEKGKVVSKPVRNKMPIEIDKPLEPDPRVKVNVPRPDEVQKR